MRRDTMLLVSHSEIKIKTHFAYKAEKHIRAHRVRLRYILLRWKIFVIFSPLHLLVAYYSFLPFSVLLYMFHLFVSGIHFFIHLWNEAFFTWTYTMLIAKVVFSALSLSFGYHFHLFLFRKVWMAFLLEFRTNFEIKIVSLFSHFD